MNARRLEHFEALLQRERQRILSVLEHAMATSGARCGRPIPDERLELLPATRTCGRSSPPA